MEQPEVARNLDTVIVHTIFFPDWKLAGPAVIRLTFMMGTFCFSIHAIASGLRRWPFNRNFCQFSALVVEYILGLVQVSLCILTLVSINQYFCVVRQQKYLTFSCKKKKKTIVSVLVMWCLRLLLTRFSNPPIIYMWNPYSLYCLAIFPSASREISF